MKRWLTTAVLALAAPALAQQPTPPVVTKGTQPADPYTPLTWTYGPVKPAVGSVDEAIASALKSHPDVRVAEAKRLLAEAELEQARLAVAQKVTAAFAQVEQAKAGVAVAEAQFARMKSTLGLDGRVSKQEVEQAQAALQTAKAVLEKAAADLKAVTAAPKATATYTNAVAEYYRVLGYDRAATYYEKVETKPVAAGSVADKLRVALGKKVKLSEMKGKSLTEALDTLKEASGLDIAVRAPTTLRAQTFVLPAGEMSVAAWFELMMDEYNTSIPSLKVHYAMYLREYGLLVAEAPPADAVTLTEFARRVRAEKAEQERAEKRAMGAAEGKTVPLNPTELKR